MVRSGHWRKAERHLERPGGLQEGGFSMVRTGEERGSGVTWRARGMLESEYLDERTVGLYMTGRDGRFLSLVPGWR